MNFLKRRKASPKNPSQSLKNIKHIITERTGITDFIELDDVSAAFSGTRDNYDLYLSLGICQKRGKEYLYAYMEDRLEFYEWEYKSLEEFENSIADCICEDINQTIKTITETKRHKYVRVTEYYLDKETNQWVLRFDKKVSWLIMRPFIEADNIEEEIKEYKLYTEVK